MLERDYLSYCGRLLEKFFHELFAHKGRYNRIGGYWEKGNQNEIDLVAINDMKKEIVMAEIKFNKAKIDLEVVKRKARSLLAVYPTYKPKWLGLSLEDAKEYL